MAAKITKLTYNRYPQEFAEFYEPILLLKKIVSYGGRKLKEIMDLKEFRGLIQKFVIAYYSTFIISDLIARNNDKIKLDKVYKLRKNFEEILSEQDLIITPKFISSLSSYVDFVGKEINTVNREYLYVSFYSGYLNYLIYEQIHKDLVINDYRYLIVMSDSTIAKWKEVSEFFSNKINVVKIPFYK